MRGTDLHRGPVALVALCALAISLLTTSVALARADGRRYAVVIGNDRGHRHETELRYAERDARRIRELLTSVAGFAPGDVALLTGADADTSRRAVIDMNERLRVERRTGAPASLLFVYYSGHADAEGLHLGRSTLRLDELQKLVRGSAADLRLLVVDACRSGALTQVKGARAGAPFVVDIEDRVASEGLVFITSSSANEDSQESDLLQSSIFTHHFVSGLLGAADVSGDRRVTLSEVYRYAYDHTTATSSRTIHGVQHPTFRYELKGRRDPVLIDLRGPAPARGRLRLDRAGHYLLFDGDEHGPVVAEVVSDGPRLLSLRPGDYFVRVREPDHLLEGSLELEDGEERPLPRSELTSIEYARLVRKGGSERRLAHGPVLMGALRGELMEGLGWMYLGGAAYGLELPWFSLTPRVLAGVTTVRNRYVEVEHLEVDVGVAVSRALDLPFLTVALGVELGAAYLRQRYTPDERAPQRQTAAFTLAVQLDVQRELFAGLYVTAQASGVTYVFDAIDRDSLGSYGERDSQTAFVPRFALGLGYHF